MGIANLARFSGVMLVVGLNKTVFLLWFCIQIVAGVEVFKVV